MPSLRLPRHVPTKHVCNSSFNTVREPPVSSQVRALREAQRGLLMALRPNAVGLVDAFGQEDYLLHSALGRKDGDVYRALLEEAQVWLLFLFVSVVSMIWSSIG